MSQIYAKKTSTGRPKALECTDNGEQKVKLTDADLAALENITVSLPDVATEITLAASKTVLDNIKIDVDKIPSKGSSNMAGSMPVTLATDGPGVANLVSIDGKLTKKVQLHANIDFSSASAQTIIAAPGAGNRIRICQLLLMSGATSPINSEVAIKSGSTTIKTVKGASIALDFPEHCNLTANEALVLLATTADRVVGGVDYYLEAV